jgi:hypothetical protein
MTTIRNVRNCTLLALAFSTVLACSGSPGPGDFRVGASRKQILESFGAPSRQQIFLKTNKHIWGPIEDFWYRIPLNSRVEVWTYRVEGGSIELYFVDQSEQVLGTGFAPDGVDF